MVKVLGAPVHVLCMFCGKDKELGTDCPNCGKGSEDISRLADEERLEDAKRMIAAAESKE